MSIMSASSTVSLTETDPSSLATEPIGMALPVRQTPYWPDAMATTQTWPQQPPRQYTSGLATTVSTAGTSPLSRAGGASVIQDQQVEYLGEQERTLIFNNCLVILLVFCYVLK